MCREVFLNFTLCGHDRQRNTPCENATYVFESGYRLCGSLTTRNDYFEDTFCEPDCCYRICNQMWRCCECRVPNRDRYDCYGCKHIICPECYPGKNTSYDFIDRVADGCPQRRIQKNGPQGKGNTWLESKKKEQMRRWHLRRLSKTRHTRSLRMKVRVDVKIKKTQRSTETSKIMGMLRTMMTPRSVTLRIIVTPTATEFENRHSTRATVLVLQLEHSLSQGHEFQSTILPLVTGFEHETGEGKWQKSGS